MSRIIVEGRDPSEIKASEEARKIKEAQNKKQEKPKQKQYFDIKVECIAPILLTYRVYAFDEKDALEQTAKIAPTNAKPNLSLKKILKAMVYKAGSSIVLFTKFFNRS